MGADSPRLRKFLQAALGEEALQALEQGLAREPKLAKAMPQRAVLSWALKACQYNYDGPIPGQDDLWLTLSKAGAMLVSDQEQVDLGQDLYKIAAALALTLELEPEPQQLATKAAQRLGKSLDQLVGTRMIRVEAEMIMGLRKAIGLIPPGKPSGPDQHDYSHVLSPDLKAKGYEMHVHSNPQTGALHARALHRGQVVGDVQASHEGEKLEIQDAHVHDQHRGQGLGLHLYEGVMAHAHQQGATHVEGGVHSSSAGKLHQALARKHGLGYNQTPTPFPHLASPQPGDYDSQHGPYQYALKTEPMAKGWPRDEQENRENAANHEVLQDAMLERGASEVPGNVVPIPVPKNLGQKASQRRTHETFRENKVADHWARGSGGGPHSGNTDIPEGRQFGDMPPNTSSGGWYPGANDLLAPGGRRLMTQRQDAQYWNDVDQQVHNQTFPIPDLNLGGTVYSFQHGRDTSTSTGGAPDDPRMRVEVSARDAHETQDTARRSSLGMWSPHTDVADWDQWQDPMQPETDAELRRHLQSYFQQNPKALTKAQSPAPESQVMADQLQEQGWKAGPEAGDTVPMSSPEEWRRRTGPTSLWPQADRSFRTIVVNPDGTHHHYLIDAPNQGRAHELAHIQHQNLHPGIEPNRHAPYAASYSEPTPGESPTHRGQWNPNGWPYDPSFRGGIPDAPVVQPTTVTDLRNPVLELEKKTAPTFPKLGFADDRRETVIADTPRQKQMMSGVQAQSVRNLAKDPAQAQHLGVELQDVAPEVIDQHFRERGFSGRGALGSVAAGPNPGPHALGPNMRRAQYQSLNPNLQDENESLNDPQAVRPVQLHENLHGLFNRVAGKHGGEARNALTQNLWGWVSYRAPKAAHAVQEALKRFYDFSGQSGKAPFEEFLATTLNLTNSRADRADLNLKLGLNEQQGRQLHQAFNTVHRHINEGGKLADERWLSPHGFVQFLKGHVQTAAPEHQSRPDQQEPLDFMVGMSPRERAQTVQAMQPPKRHFLDDMPMRKAWPKDAQENQANAMTHQVMEDALLEHGAKRQEFSNAPSPPVALVPTRSAFSIPVEDRGPILDVVGRNQHQYPRQWMFPWTKPGDKDMHGNSLYEPIGEDPVPRTRGNQGLDGNDYATPDLSDLRGYDPQPGNFTSRDVPLAHNFWRRVSTLAGLDPRKPEGLHRPDAIKKGWPANEQENSSNAVADQVLEDSMLEQGAEKRVQVPPFQSMNEKAMEIYRSPVPGGGAAEARNANREQNRAITTRDGYMLRNDEPTLDLPSFNSEVLAATHPEPPDLVTNARGATQRYRFEYSSMEGHPQLIAYLPSADRSMGGLTRVGAWNLGDGHDPVALPDEHGVMPALELHHHVANHYRGKNQLFKNLKKGWPRDEADNQDQQQGFLNQPAAQDRVIETTGAVPKALGHEESIADFKSKPEYQRHAQAKTQVDWYDRDEQVLGGAWGEGGTGGPTVPENLGPGYPMTGEEWPAHRPFKREAEQRHRSFWKDIFGLKKAWPRDEQENQTNAATHQVLGDALQERGAVEISRQAATQQARNAAHKVTQEHMLDSRRGRRTDEARNANAVQNHVPEDLVPTAPLDAPFARRSPLEPFTPKPAGWIGGDDDNHEADVQADRSFWHRLGQQVGLMQKSQSLVKQLSMDDDDMEALGFARPDAAAPQTRHEFMRQGGWQVHGREDKNPRVAAPPRVQDPKYYQQYAAQPEAKALAATRARNYRARQAEAAGMTIKPKPEKPMTAGERYQKWAASPQGQAALVAKRKAAWQAKKQVKKAWPKNDQENEANAAAQPVMEDAILEQGGKKRALDPKEVAIDVRQADNRTANRHLAVHTPEEDDAAQRRIEAIQANNQQNGFTDEDVLLDDVATPEDAIRWYTAPVPPKVENAFWARLGRQVGLKKAWPKNDQDNADQRSGFPGGAAHQVMEDQHLELGGKREEFRPDRHENLWEGLNNSEIQGGGKRLTSAGPMGLEDSDEAAMNRHAVADMARDLPEYGRSNSATIDPLDPGPQPRPMGPTGLPFGGQAQEEWEQHPHLDPMAVVYNSARGDQQASWDRQDMLRGHPAPPSVAKPMQAATRRAVGILRTPPAPQNQGVPAPDPQAWAKLKSKLGGKKVKKVELPGQTHAPEKIVEPEAPAPPQFQPQNGTQLQAQRKKPTQG